jgi:hypothetical protein
MFGFGGAVFRGVLYRYVTVDWKWWFRLSYGSSNL